MLFLTKSCFRKIHLVHDKQLLCTGESGEGNVTKFVLKFSWKSDLLILEYNASAAPSPPGWLCQLGESPGAPETFYSSWNMKMKSRQVSWIRFCHSFRINSSVDNCEADRADNSAGSNQISFLTSKWELCDFEQIQFLRSSRRETLRLCSQLSATQT